MPRQPRQEAADAAYHVYCRGNEGRDVLATDTDKRVFLCTLETAVGDMGWICIAFCVMTNHYHLIVITPLANLAAGMHLLNSSYATRYNHAHGHAGHVFQSRYGARLLRTSSELLHATRYALLNAAAAGLCDAPEEWPWSSLPATLGMCDPPPFLSPGRVLALLGGSPADARVELRRFLQAAVDPPPRPELDELVRRLDTQAILVAHRRHGYTMKEIAEHLGVAPSTITRRLQGRQVRRP